MRIDAVKQEERKDVISNDSVSRWLVSNYNIPQKILQYWIEHASGYVLVFFCNFYCCKCFYC